MLYSSSYIRLLSPIPHSALLAALFFLSFLDSLYCVGTPIFQKPQEHNVKLTIFPLENGNITEERNSRDAENRSKTRPLSPLAHTLSHTPSLKNSHTLTNTLSHTLFLSHTRSLLHTLSLSFSSLRVERKRETIDFLSWPITPPPSVSLSTLITLSKYFSAPP